MSKTNKKKGRIWRGLATFLLCLTVFVGSVLGILQLGVYCSARSWEHWSPDYEKVDIRPVLSKETLTDEDYQTLYRQTGLTKLGIDGFLEKNDISTVIELQEFFFSKHTVTADKFAAFTYLEEIEEYAPMAVLEDGDIIVSATTRVSWFRYGHAALVVDGESKRIVESLAPGYESEINSAKTFADLANFLVLRPKADKETRTQVAAYAKENLVGLPYQMTTGILSKKYNPDELKRSQCAHLVWYAYKKFGIDLDSTGGLVVKPRDVANSEHVEVVQAFGFDLDALWS
ncbi:MAG: hypothetical protein IJ514_01680 [Clostridia bacterium]|nr:hypothetical protein [Clostridia bacterium]